MYEKIKLRKKFFLRRKKKYFEISTNFFKPLNVLITKNFKKKNINVASYYPSFFEVDVLNIFKFKFKRKLTNYLPVISGKNTMKFFYWKPHEALKINKFGMLEPASLNKNVVPDLMLVPLLAYDKNKFRLGYGKGYYDKYLFKLSKINKKIISIGVAFSFQKHHKLPTNNLDFKLDYVLTEKGLIK